MLFVPLIDIADVNNPSAIVERMQDVTVTEVAYVNWPGDYPSAPKVAFKIAHNGSSIFLHFFVEENEVLAKTTEDNGPVWTDSCVEFFVSFADSPFYYNAEFSCIGKALLGYRKDRKNVEHAGAEIMGSIKRYSSLGSESFEKKQGGFKWNMLVVIPISAYWHSGLKTFSGVKARANFYKCGDDLTTPHFLSWNPIRTDKPDFHVPEYFGELNFE
ncbi:MAG: hypothetical protein LBL79_09790 [Prevotella sp.]|jgi:hypothetical protein|nr:hypothetical protein [Prevotella sp.]